MAASLVGAGVECVRTVSSPELDGLDTWGTVGYIALMWLFHLDAGREFNLASRYNEQAMQIKNEQDRRLFDEE